MFFVLSRAWDQNPMRNRTSDLRIPHSNTLPLSHRDSTVSEAYYKVHKERVLHTARISDVDSVIIEIREMVNFELGKETKIDVFCLVTSVSYFYLQTLRYRHCWSYQYAGHVSYELCNRPRSPWSLCGSVVEHRSAESEGQSFDSSWDSEFFLNPTLVKRRKKSSFKFEVAHRRKLFVMCRFTSQRTWLNVE